LWPIANSDQCQIFTNFIFFNIRLDHFFPILTNFRIRFFRYGNNDCVPNSELFLYFNFCSNLSFTNIGTAENMVRLVLQRSGFKIKKKSFVVFCSFHILNSKIVFLGGIGLILEIFVWQCYIEQRNVIAPSQLFVRIGYIFWIFCAIFGWKIRFFDKVIILASISIMTKHEI